MKYSILGINRKEDLFFGIALHPVTTRRGLIIGGGMVYPELNFVYPQAFILDPGNVILISREIV